MNLNDLNSNKKIAEAFFVQLINERNYSAISKIFAEDVEILPRGLSGHVGVREWLQSFHDTFPDCIDVITGQWADADQVVTRIRFTGTHQGVWMGFEPTGEKVSWEGIAVHTIIDGRIRLMETVIEQTHVFRQLGWLNPNNQST